MIYLTIPVDGVIEHRFFYLLEPIVDQNNPDCNINIYKKELQNKVFTCITESIKVKSEQLAKISLKLKLTKYSNNSDYENLIVRLIADYKKLREDYIIITESIQDESMEETLFKAIYLEFKYYWHLFHKSNSSDEIIRIIEYPDMYEDPEWHWYDEPTDEELQNPYDEVLNGSIENEISGFTLYEKYLNLEKISKMISILEDKILNKQNSNDETKEENFIEIDENEISLKVFKWTATDVAKCLFIRIKYGSLERIEHGKTYINYAKEFMGNEKKNGKISSAYNGIKNIEPKKVTGADPEKIIIEEFKKSLLDKRISKKLKPQYLPSFLSFERDQKAYDWLKNFCEFNSIN